MDLSYDSWPPSPMLSASSLPAPAQSQKDKPKKPRHRHSPAQLAALNELYDKNEHPPLDLRTSLAERLGMETKTVNAWFQNKRASSKKRTRGGVPVEAPPTISLEGSAPSSTSNTPRHIEMDDLHDDDYSFDSHNSQSASATSPDNTRPLASFYAGNPDHTHFLAESDTMPRRMRMRPSQEQTDELRKLYNVNPHPTTDQRQALSDRIGMRYQSITNWFQNQRSLAKKRKEDEADADAALVASRVPEYNDSRTYSAFPPPSSHPSLRLPSSAIHPTVSHLSRGRRSPSNSPSMDEPISRKSNPRRSITPYGSASNVSRPRRSRPEPYQLDALKDLYTKTPTPTIEERSALALEIGMDIGKVTNWFRNLRQTARKRAKKTGSGDDDDYDNFGGHNIYSTSVSRSVTPSLHSSSSSLNGDSMDLDINDFDMFGSDMGSDDDYQEAVTPSPEQSPPPPLSVPSHVALRRLSLAIDPASYAELEKVTAAQYSGIKIEDALLLLSFHQHIVH